MKITVNSRTYFRFPTALIINRFTAGIIRRKLKKEGITLPLKQTLLLIKELKRYKKNHTEWNLVEIEDQNGNTVQIKI